jgi:arabinosaccharide transport system substrate-binding protein
MKAQRISRREFLSLAGAASSAALFAACAPSAAPAGAPVAPAPAATTAPAPAVTELVFWTFVAAHQDYYLKQVEGWNEANPDRQIKLNAATYPYDEHHDKLLIALQSGTGAPDIVDIEVAKFGLFLRGDIQLHDLTDLIDRHRDKLILARVALYSYGGKQYGIPTHLGAYVMFYNKDMTDAAGIDIEGIKTWDDFIAAGKEFPNGKDDAWWTALETTDRHTYIGPSLQNGGGVYDADGNFIMDSQPNVEVLQMQADMLKQHKIATLAPGGYFHDPAWYEYYNKSKVAAIWMPQWYMIREEFLPDLAGKMRIRPMPLFEAGGYTSAMGGGTGTAITKQTAPDKLGLAKDFLEYAKLTYDANIRIWKQFGLDPFRWDVYDDPELLGEMPYWGGEKPMLVIKEVAKNIAGEHLGPKYPEAMEVMRETLFIDALQGDVPAAEALKKAAEATLAR